MNGPKLVIVAMERTMEFLARVNEKSAFISG